MTNTDRTKNILVAVYGSLKAGFGNHHYLNGAKFVTNAAVSGFRMFSLTAFPMIIEGEGIVTVELYEVTPAIFRRLDGLEGFPGFYGRQVVPVQTDSCELEAWVYYGQPHQVQGCKPVPSGDWQGDAYRPKSVRLASQA